MAGQITADATLQRAAAVSGSSRSQARSAPTDCTIISDAPIVFGTPRHDVICLGSHNHLVIGLGGGDIIRGGAGNDLIIGGPGNDVIRGGGGRDIILGGGGDDTCTRAVVTLCTHIIDEISTPTLVTKMSDGSPMDLVVGALSVHTPFGAISPGQTITLRTTGITERTTLIDWTNRLTDAFDVSTSQGQPNVPVEINAGFDGSALPPGVQPVLLNDIGGAIGWIPEPGTFDPAAKVATAMVDHFSPKLWVDQFKYSVNAFVENRFDGGLNCTEPPSWITGSIFPNSNSDAVLVCPTPGTDASTLKLAIANNRGYAQALQIHGAELDFSQSTWGDNVTDTVNHALARVATSLLKPADTFMLAPKSTGILTIHRKDLASGQVVTIDSLNPGARAVASLILQWTKRATGVATLPVDLADCVAGYFANSLGDPSAVGAAATVKGCIDVAGTVSSAVKTAWKKFAVAIIAVDNGSRLIDAMADSTYPGHIEFEVVGDTQIDTNITLINGDLGARRSGQSFTIPLGATGGTAPYTFTVSPAAVNKDRVPPWAKLEPSGTLTLDIPSDVHAGPYSFYVIITDAKGKHTPTSTQLVKFTVVPTDAGSGGVVTTYRGISLPEGITTGPDGALWFANRGNNSIGRITTAGTITNYSDPSIGQPEGITVGADGALWFENVGDSSIGRITTAGTVSSFPVSGIGGAAYYSPHGITAGPDGALWFTMAGADSIGRITTAGVVTMYSVDGMSAVGPRSITVGPDHALWFTSGGGIGRITTEGVVTTYDSGGAGADAITAGPDGALWFAGYESIGRITTVGAITHYANPHVVASDMIAGSDGALWFTGNVNGRITTAGSITTYGGRAGTGITSGPDGALWLTNVRDNVGPGRENSIGRISTSGSVSSYYSSVNGPVDMVAGSDGALWFTNISSNSIGRITTDGTLTTFYPPAFSGTVSGPYAITVGPDGALWFTNAGNNSIGRISTAGNLTRYGGVDISGIFQPFSITLGPDGALWFTNSTGLAGGDSIGRITTAGNVTYYRDVSVRDPRSITAGPDGALWFTNWTDSSVGRISTTGVITSFGGTGTPGASGITSGPDGALWFCDGDAISRITTSGAITKFADPDVGYACSIARGPDGALWFSDSFSNTIGRITTAGVITKYVVSVSDSPYGSRTITAGPDGAMWFTDQASNDIGRITTP
jgi:streptogramin lyase